MKKCVFITVIFISICSALFSQHVIRMQPCQNPGIENQADSIKQLITNDGFELLKASSITMESDYEMPVIVP